MNKVITIIITLALLLSLCSCGAKSVPQQVEVSIDFGEVQQEWQEKRDAPAATIPGENATGTVEYTAVRNWVDRDGNPWADIMCQIRNTGDSPMHIRYVDFDLKTTSGKVLRDDSFGIWQQSIAPGECAYLFKTAWLDSQDQIVADIEPRCVFEATETQPAGIDCSNVSVEETDGFVQMTLTATNNNEAPVSNETFYVVLLDADGNIAFSACSMWFDGMAAGASSEYTIDFNLPTVFATWNDVPDYIVMAWEEL